MASACFLIKGHVQGVFFRAAKRRRASELGLEGFARNCADGSVEVVASGALPALAELEAWLQHGPPAARVDTVERSAAPAQRYSGFVTL